MQVNGLWSDGKTSKVSSAHLKIIDTDGELQVWVSNSIIVAENIRKVEISPRLGQTPRKIRFQSGGMFETDDNDAIDKILASKKPSFDIIHAMESNLLVCIFGVLIVGLIAWWFVVEGLPKTSNYIAQKLPDSVTESLGKQVLSIFDFTSFEDTTLSEEHQKAISDMFYMMVTEANLNEKNCEIKFFSAKDSFGPNAFALPPCLIIVTDEFVELTKNDDEIMAVLAHELGHIHHRHSLRRIVQSSFVSFVILMLSGDATQLSADVIAIPALFMELGYSRDFEREADKYAYDYMVANNIPLNSFPDILERMQTWYPEHEEHEHDINHISKEDDVDIKPEESEVEKKVMKWTKYLSTHPETEERAVLFRK